MEILLIVSATDLLTGVVAGVVAAALWTLSAWGYRLWSFKQDFDHLAGKYLVTEKMTGKPAFEAVSIRVDKNILQVDAEGLPDGDSITGEIAMNEQLHRSGKDGIINMGGVPIGKLVVTAPTSAEERPNLDFHQPFLDASAKLTASSSTSHGRMHSECLETAFTLTNRVSRRGHAVAALAPASLAGARARPLCSIPVRRGLALRHRRVDREPPREN